MPRITPVDYDPFNQGSGSSPAMEPVDYDPFKEVAPASGVFPAVQGNGRATVPSSTVLPAISAPPPSQTPVSESDQGIVTELTGDAIKGMHSTKRGAMLTAYAVNAYDDVDNIARTLASSKDIEAQYPSSPAAIKAAEELETQKSSGAGGILPSLGVYAKNPKFAVSTAVQSLPSMLGSVVTVPVGAGAGALLAGPPGAAVGGALGLGVGSAAADFGNSFEDFARDNWKPQTAEDWKAILLDPTKYREAGNYAAKHAGMVGIFDAVGSKLGGKIGSKIVGDRIVNPVGRVAASSVAGSPISAAVGAVGEASGQLAGSGEITDPGAVAGEFAAGLVTDIPSTAIEPIVHATNFGGRPNTPATEEGIRAATEAIIPTPAPEDVSGSMVTGDVTPTFYSPTRRYVEEKGPGAATPEQWEATLKNAPGVKQEELQDLGLDKFLEGKQGKLTKAQVLNHLDEQGITIQETQRQNVTERDDGSDDWLKRDFNHAKYEGYTLPGERQGYTELTMHMPTMNTPEYDFNTSPLAKEIHKAMKGRVGDLNDVSPAAIEMAGHAELADRWAAEMAAHPTDTTQRDFVGGHYTEPNVIAHMRVTDRIDTNGTPMALLEEMQSDWHQAGRKRGYAGQEMTNPAFMDAIDERIGQHIDTTNEQGPLRQAFTGWGGDTLVEAQRAGVITAEEAARYTRDMKGTNPVAAGPFKQSWDELAFKRFLRWAADKGYRRVGWVNSAEQMRRYPGGAGEEKRAQGMQQFYDKVIPSLAKKWAKRLGGTTGETVLNDVARGNAFQIVAQNGEVLDSGLTQHDAQITVEGDPTLRMIPDPGGVVTLGDTVGTAAARTVVQHIDIPQNGIDLIQRGLPMYSQVDESRKKGGVTLDELAGGPTYAEVGRQLTEALQEVAKDFNLPVNLKVVFHEGGVIRRRQENGRNKLLTGILGQADYRNNTIHINPALHPNAAAMWATMMHEFGHFIMFYKYHKADAHTKVAIKAAFDEFLANTPYNQNMEKFIARRDNAVITYFNVRNFKPGQTLENVSQRKYWMHFEEWFAEQTARWATTNVKPLSTVEKFFHIVGRQILDFLEKATRKFNMSFEASAAVNSWLNSFHTDAAPFAQDVNTENDVKTQTENQVKMGSEEKAEPRQPETLVAREAVDKVFDGRPPGEVKEAAAYADKFNRIYKWMLGIHQVAQRNPHIAPLQEYTETIAVAQLTKQQIMIRAQEVLKAWNRLGGRQADAVAAFIDDVQNMTYLTDEEVKNKVARFPTQAEIADLTKKHGVSEEGLAVFKQVADTFNEHLTRYEAVLRNEAKKITDPVEMAGRMIAITNQIKNLRSRPYFPAMRFGDYTITVRNAAKQVIHFETFEKERTRNAAADAIRAQYGVTKDDMQLGKLDKQVKPLMGVPTQLLELMGKKLGLSAKQRDALEQLKFELSPAQSFKHRFQHKRRVAGYSMDFRRSYAAYFFHGANHLMKAMYADRLRNLMAQTRAETNGVYDATTRHEITAFMNDHLENWLDPKSDWAAIRSIAFLWQLAWTPAAAAQNLTQTLMTTYPFLAQQFGDTKALAALARTGADFTTFYKTGKLNAATEFELKALGRGIQDGIINEAMAPELAGFAEGGNLRLGFGGNELQRGMQTFNEWGAKMFEMAEQVNRRLVFRATLKLMQENPGTKYGKEVVAKHKLHFDQLRAEGWTEAEATAYVAARDATITTQFQYGREYAPRFMRGKARSIFVFKTFIQNYVLFLANYPAAAVRSLLIMGALGGLMGIPGGEDLREILKAVGWRMFGKDFDLDKEARRLMIQLFGENEAGREAADMVLHGIARQGYGIPSFMDMLGGTVGVDIPMPRLDRSASISAGTLLPIELGKLFGPPTQDADAIISGQAQKASGAVFGTGFNVYKALTNTKLNWSDSKRWEKAVPRAIGSVAKAYRVGTEGRERTSTGSTLVKYDVRDTQQLMEVMAIAAGYTPYRQSLQWNRVMAGQDAVKLWDTRRTGLMKQMGNAVLGKDEKEIDNMREAIKKFNSSLPPEARGKAISSDTLRQSIGTQARTRQAQEAELSVKKSDIPILREVQKLYPASQATSVRRVPRSLQ